MKNIIYLLILPALLCMASCKNKNGGKSGKIESLSDLKDYSENVQKEMTESNSRWEKRKAIGDTAAIPYKDLEAYLPEVSGYSKEGGPKGSQMNTFGLGSWSQAEQDYVSGDNRVSVKIFDYNGAQQAFMGMTAAFALGFSFEDDSKKQAPVEMGITDVSAYETIYKTDKRAEMVLVIAGRFVVNIETRGSNDEGFLMSVAKSMNLKELASK